LLFLCLVTGKFANVAVPLYNSQKVEVIFLKVEFLGHAAFLITEGDYALLFDPFLTGNPSAAKKADEVKPTHIFVSHAHSDRLGDTIAITKNSGATVYTVFELAEIFEKKGVKVMVSESSLYVINFSANCIPASLRSWNITALLARVFNHLDFSAIGFYVKEKQSRSLYRGQYIFFNGIRDFV